MSPRPLARSARTEEGKRRHKPLHFLVHAAQDDVGVTVVDVKKGQHVAGMTLDTREPLEIEALANIPLGHKIALRRLAKGATVTKYGHDIGKVVAPIAVGDHVHVHNVKTKRW